MEATKQHAFWESGCLDEGLEHLLHEYELSIGKDKGVPRELIQGASRIAAEHAKVCAAGPADCTPSSEDLQQEITFLRIWVRIVQSNVRLCWMEVWMI